MPPKDKATKKKEYFAHIASLVQSCSKVIIVGVDHVGSKQLADVRRSLRGKAVILMGKNTKIRKCLNVNRDSIPHADVLLSTVRLNVGFVFCMIDPTEVLNIMMDPKNKVPALAKLGTIAPNSVSIPAGATGMDPSKTSFFQALGIATKIVKGQIEIQQNIDLIEKGTKVTASQSVLLQMLNVKPFSYGLQPVSVYDDGAVYDAEVLSIKDETILEKFSAGVQNLAAFSRQIGVPTQASISHSILEGFKHCTSIALESGFEFSQMLKIKQMVENPEAFAVAAPAAAVVAAPEAKKVEAPAEEESDEDGPGLLDLFG